MALAASMKIELPVVLYDQFEANTANDVEVFARRITQGLDPDLSKHITKQLCLKIYHLAAAIQGKATATLEHKADDSIEFDFKLFNNPEQTKILSFCVLAARIADCVQAQEEAPPIPAIIGELLPYYNQLSVPVRRSPQVLSAFLTMLYQALDLNAIMAHYCAQETEHSLPNEQALWRLTFHQFKLNSALQKRRALAAELNPETDFWDKISDNAQAAITAFKTLQEKFCPQVASFFSDDISTIQGDSDTDREYGMRGGSFGSAVFHPSLRSNASASVGVGAGTGAGGMGASVGLITPTQTLFDQAPAYLLWCALKAIDEGKAVSLADLPPVVQAEARKLSAFAGHITEEFKRDLPIVPVASILVPSTPSLEETQVLSTTLGIMHFFIHFSAQLQRCKPCEISDFIKSFVDHYWPYLSQLGGETPRVTAIMQALLQGDANPMAGCELTYTVEALAKGSKQFQIARQKVLKKIAPAESSETHVRLREAMTFAVARKASHRWSPFQDNASCWVDDLLVSKHAKDFQVQRVYPPLKSILAKIASLCIFAESVDQGISDKVWEERFAALTGLISKEVKQLCDVVLFTRLQCFTGGQHYYPAQHFIQACFRFFATNPDEIKDLQAEIRQQLAGKRGRHFVIYDREALAQYCGVLAEQITLLESRFSGPKKVLAALTIAGAGVSAYIVAKQVPKRKGNVAKPWIGGNVALQCFVGLMWLFYRYQTPSVARERLKQTLLSFANAQPGGCTTALSRMNSFAYLLLTLMLMACGVGSNVVMGLSTQNYFAHKLLKEGKPMNQVIHDAELIGYLSSVLSMITLIAMIEFSRAIRILPCQATQSLDVEQQGLALELPNIGGDDDIGADMERGEDPVLDSSLSAPLNPHPTVSQNNGCYCGEAQDILRQCLTQLSEVGQRQETGLVSVERGAGVGVGRWDGRSADALLAWQAPQSSVQTHGSINKVDSATPGTS